MMTQLTERIIHLSQLLKPVQWKISTAESCTGGGLSFELTAIPGSSAWFERGFVTYTDIAKQEMLSVASQTLTEHGAVSEQTAIEMALGALKHSQAQISVAITGIAGPTGGSLQKPVGTVWIACASIPQKADAKLYSFKGDRESIRAQSISAAVEALIATLRRRNT